MPKVVDYEALRYELARRIREEVVIMKKYYPLPSSSYVRFRTLWSLRKWIRLNNTDK